MPLARTLAAVASKTVIPMVEKVEFIADMNGTVISNLHFEDGQGNRINAPDQNHAPQTNLTDLAALIEALRKDGPVTEIVLRASILQMVGADLDEALVIAKSRIDARDAAIAAAAAASVE